jgi:hypothetical protein
VVKPGLCVRVRSAYRRSCSREDTKSLLGVLPKTKPVEEWFADSSPGRGDAIG